MNLFAKLSQVCWTHCATYPAKFVRPCVSNSKTKSKTERQITWPSGRPERKNMSKIKEASEDGITVFDIPAYSSNCGKSSCWICTGWKKGDTNAELHRAEYGYTKKSETQAKP